MGNFGSSVFLLVVSCHTNQSRQILKKKSWTSSVWDIFGGAKNGTSLTKSPRFRQEFPKHSGWLSKVLHEICTDKKFLELTSHTENIIHIFRLRGGGDFYLVLPNLPCNWNLMPVTTPPNCRCRELQGLWGEDLSVDVAARFADKTAGKGFFGNTASEIPFS